MIRVVQVGRDCPDEDAERAAGAVTRLSAIDWNATTSPSALMAGAPDAASPASPATLSLTRTISPVVRSTR